MMKIIYCVMSLCDEGCDCLVACFKSENDAIEYINQSEDHLYIHEKELIGY